MSLVSGHRLQFASPRFVPTYFLHFTSSPQPAPPNRRLNSPLSTNSCSSHLIPSHPTYVSGRPSWPSLVRSANGPNARSSHLSSTSTPSEPLHRRFSFPQLASESDPQQLGIRDATAAQAGSKRSLVQPSGFPPHRASVILSIPVASAPSLGVGLWICLRQPTRQRPARQAPRLSLPPTSTPVAIFSNRCPTLSEPYSSATLLDGFPTLVCRYAVPGSTTRPSSGHSRT